MKGIGPGLVSEKVGQALQNQDNLSSIVKSVKMESWFKYKNFVITAKKLQYSYKGWCTY